MNFIAMTKDGVVRNIPATHVEKFTRLGWTIPGADQEPLAQKAEALPKDPGPVVAKAPKKKTAKSAETAPEAATVDLGNDITQGD